MAGLLDSLRPILGGTAAFAPHYRRQDQAAKNEQMQGLLDMYGRGSSDASGMPRSSSSPNMGPQGLMGGGQQGSGYLPPQFYQEAGMLPGNQRFLAQDQIAGQAMQAQMQEQRYNQANMSAYDAAQLAQRQSQFEGVSGAAQAQLNQQNAQYQQTFGGISKYQEAVLQNDADRIPAASSPSAQPPAKPPTGYQYKEDGNSLMAIPGGKEAERQMLAVAPMDTAIDTIDRALAFLAEKGSYESGPESVEMSALLKQDVVSGLQAATGAGTLGESEADRLASQAWDFNAKSSLFTMDETAEAKLKALRKSMSRQRDKTVVAQGGTPPKAPKVPPVP
jgi:hypothetical protein